MEAIKVNLIPNGIPEACHASQYDEGRQIRLDLFDGLTPYTIQAGDTFTLNVRKPDNHVITQTVTGTEGNSYLVIETSEQMTAVTGENLCEIRLENGGDNIGSLNFIMQVEKDVIANGIPSESVIEDLDTLVVEAVGDNYYTKSEVDALIENVEDNTRIVDEASGAIARFNTDVVLPLIDVKAEIKAVETGTGAKSPSNPYVISGFSAVSVYHSGGNFFNKNTVESGKLINGSGNEVTYSDWNLSDYIEVIEGASYYLYGLTFHPNTNQDNFELFDENKNKVGFANVKTNEQPYLIPSGVKYIKCSVKNSDLDTAQFSVSINASFVPYNPFIEKTVINLGGTYYGGSVDAVTGKITLTHSHITNLGSNIKSCNKESNLWRVEYNSAITQTGNPYKEGICNMLAFKTSYANINTNNNSVGINSSIGLLFRNDDITTAQEATDFLAALDIVYPLATPIVVYASNTAEIPTIVGVNQVFADSGNISVKYKKSVKAYIDDKLKAIFVSYDNSNSGLTATNTQAAIDELAGANRSVNPLRTSAPVEELETRDEPETDEPETRGDDNEER